LNRAFDVLDLLLGWVLHPLWLIPLALLSLLGLNACFRHGDQMLVELGELRQSYPIWILIPCLVFPVLLLLNFVHAVLLGICARKFGVSIRDFGVRLWGGFIPTFRTDLDDAFAQLDDRGRHTLTRLGWWVPLAIGSLGAVGWAICAPRSELGVLLLLMVPASVVRLIVHSNPFFSYSSAYFVLCSVADNWSLLPWALDETRAWLSGQTSPRALGARERKWLRIYGVAYWIYRALLTAGLLALALWWLLPQYHLLGMVVLAWLLYWTNRDLWSRRPVGGLPGMGASAR
jgi:hypothetical protein